MSSCWISRCHAKFHHSILNEIRDIFHLAAIHFIKARWKNKCIPYSVGQVHDPLLFFVTPVKILSILLKHSHSLNSRHHFLKHWQGNTWKPAIAQCSFLVEKAGVGIISCPYNIEVAIFYKRWLGNGKTALQCALFRFKKRVFSLNYA